MAQITYLAPAMPSAIPADGAGFNSVVVNNDASTISFTMNSTQPQASYIFYAIELQIIRQAGSGYTGFANPFGPAVGISSGENALIDTFGTGATPYIYSGGWVAGSAVSYAAGGTGTTSTTITVPLTSLGLSAGSQFTSTLFQLTLLSKTVVHKQLMVHWIIKATLRSQMVHLHLIMAPHVMTLQQTPLARY